MLFIFRFLVPQERQQMSRSPHSRTTGTADAQADLEWCHEAVQDVSRTFALTIDVLEEPMSSAICVGYLLCRVADTVEDANDIPAAEQVALLEAYDAALDPDSSASVETFAEAVEPHAAEREGSDDWAVVADAVRAVRAFEAQPEAIRAAILPPVRELVQGMALFVDRYAETEGLRIQTPDELEEYCYYVAGTVGNLITRLICTGKVSPETARRLREHTQSFALLLQLVNIAKDVYVDYHAENNVYLPATWLRERGVSQDDLCDPEHTDQVTAVIRKLVDRAQGYLDPAQTYLEHAPETRGNTLAAWGIPYLLAVGTIRELRDRPEDALSKAGVKVGRAEVLAVVAEMTGDADRESLSTLRETIARRPYRPGLEPT